MRLLWNGVRRFGIETLFGILFFAFPLSAFAQADCRIIVIAANRVQSEAQAFSEQFISTLGTEIRQSPNGVFAVVLKVSETNDNRSLLPNLIAAEKIPADAHCSSGNGYGPTLHSYAPKIVPRSLTPARGGSADFDTGALGLSLTFPILFGLLWAICGAVILKRAVKKPIKKRSIMRAPDVENLYPMEILEVCTKIGQRFEKGETLVVFQRFRGFASKRIVAREDGQTIDVCLEANTRLDQPAELLVVQHDNAEETQEPYKLPLGKLAVMTVGLLGLYGAVYVLSDVSSVDLVHFGDLARSNRTWIIAGVVAFFGGGLALRFAKHLNRKRKEAHEPQGPRQRKLLPALIMTLLALVGLWVADHGYRVTDDIHWILLISGLFTLLVLAPFIVFYWRRYDGRGNEEAGRAQGSATTNWFDGIAVTSVIFLLIMQWVAVAGGSSFLRPGDHSKKITTAFVSAEAGLAVRLPSLFGPDANDIRRAREAAKQLERDRIIVAEYNARMIRANEARAHLAPIKAYAQDYWPKVIDKIRNSACRKYRDYRHARGTRPDVRTLKGAAENAKKFINCVRQYQQANSAILSENYNVIVHQYQNAAITALETSRINHLQLADANMVSAILERDLIEVHRAEVIHYIERNKSAAIARAKTRELEEKRRRENMLNWARIGQKARRQIDQNLQNILDPNYFKPAGSQTGRWVQNAGTPVSEFEFEDGESIEEAACQFDCGESPAAKAAKERQVEAMIAKSEWEYEEAQDRIRDAEDAKEKADALAAKKEAEALAAEESDKRAAEFAKEKAEAEEEAEREKERKRLEEERRKAEADDGCFPVSGSCIIDESNWKGDKFFLRLRNACSGRVYITYCVSSVDGRPDCGATGIRPGKREVSQMFSADSKALVRWRVVGSSKGSMDWVCAGKNPDWNKPLH